MTADELYAVIERESERGYRLADNEFGFSYIRREDVIGDGSGRFVVQFRLPYEIGESTMRLVVERVCDELGYKPEAYRALANEYGIDYWECRWILSERQGTK